MHCGGAQEGQIPFRGHSYNFIFFRYRQASRTRNQQRIHNFIALSRRRGISRSLYALAARCAVLWEIAKCQVDPDKSASVAPCGVSIARRPTFVGFYFGCCLTPLVSETFPTTRNNRGDFLLWRHPVGETSNRCSAHLNNTGAWRRGVRSLYFTGTPLSIFFCFLANSRTIKHR